MVQQSSVLRLLQDVTLGISRATTADEAYRIALSELAGYAGWPLAHVYLRASDEQSVVSGDIWYVGPDHDFTAFQAVTRQTPHRPGVDDSLVSDVVTHGRPRLLADVRTEERFLRGRYGDFGLRGYFAFPVAVDGEVESVLEYFSTEAGYPPDDLLQVIEHVSALLATAHQRFRAEEALRESEQRFKAIFNQTFQFIGLMKPDGTLMEANETALQFGGLRPEDVIDRPFWEAHWWTISPETQERLREAIVRAARGELVRYDVDVLGEGGRVATIDFSIKPVFNEAGDVVLLIPEGRDITVQKTGHDRLMRSEELLAEAQRIAHVGHWEWDVATNEVVWSDELFRIWGIEPSGPRTYEDVMRFVHPDDLNFLEHKVADALHFGTPYDVYNRIIRPDGSVRVIHSLGQPVFDHHGQVVKLRGTAQDRTDEREKEIALAQTIRQLSTLNRLSQAIAASLELPVIYSRVLAQMRPLMDADVVLIFAYEDGGLVVKAADESGIGNILGVRVEIDRSVVGEVWRSGRSAYLVGDECRQRLSPILTERAGFEPRAVIAAPIRWQDEYIGVLEAASGREDAFSREDLSLLETVAAWTAIAVGKARQYDQLQRQLRESEGISALSQALIELRDVEYVLGTVVSVARNVLPRTFWAGIALLNEETEQLRLVVSSGEMGPFQEGAELADPEFMSVLRHGHVGQVERTNTDGERMSLLIAPVQSRARRSGLLFVACHSEMCESTDDGQLLHVLGVQSGLALDNARLLEEQRHALDLAERRRERMLILAQRIVSAQEDERLRISRELHDEAGQALTSLKISLSLLRDMLSPEEADLRQNLGELMSLTDDTMKNLRLLSHNLRPPGLDEYGLDAVLAGLCQDFATRTRMRVTYQAGDLPQLQPLVSLSLYRFVQEALTNAAKHAEAQRVDVTMDVTGHEIRLTVDDDGRGFDPAANGNVARARGVGLTNMAERLEMINGRLEIDSRVGEGTRVIATIPLGDL